MVGISSSTMAKQLEEMVVACDSQLCGRLKASEFLSTIDDKLSYLSVPWREDIINLFRSYPSILSEVHGQNSVWRHGSDVGDAPPIKRHAYHCSTAKREQKFLNYSTWPRMVLLSPVSAVGIPYV